MLVKENAEKSTEQAKANLKLQREARRAESHQLVEDALRKELEDGNSQKKP